MDHLPSPVQNHTLDLVLTVVWAPIARLKKTWDLSWPPCERLLSFCPPCGKRCLSGAVVFSPWQTWSCMCRRRSPCFWWAPRHSAPASAAGSVHCGCTSLPCSTRSGLRIYTETMLQLFLSSTFFILAFRPRKIFHRLDKKLEVLNKALVHLGRVTLTCPEEMISTDFPQNLFFHLWSENSKHKEPSLNVFKKPLALLSLQQDSSSPDPTAPTLPESEVLGLCMTGRDWRVMANLKVTQDRITPGSKLRFSGFFTWTFLITCSLT